MAITLGETVESRFSILYPDLHFYTVQLEEGTTYTVDITDTLTRSSVSIVDSGSEALARNTDSDGNRAPRFEWTAPRSDTYFVMVIGAYTNSYTLTVTGGETARAQAPTQTATPGIFPTAPPPTPALVLGDEYRNIELGEAASSALFGIRYFKFELEAGTTYTIEVSLGTLEISILTLLDGEAEVLERDTDFDRVGARIVWAAQRTGPYFVRVGGKASGPGSYTLTVKEGVIARASAPAQTTTPPISPTSSPSAAALTFAAVSAGGEHTCGVTTSGAAYCWGYGKYGSLGNGLTDGQTTPVAVSAGLTFASVSAGYFHTCGVTTGAAAYCWGFGRAGRLGNGLTTDQPTPVAVSGGLTFASVSSGSNHTCGVTTSGSAHCWGEGYNAVLGDGSRRDQTAPVPVSGGLTFASVSAGNGHTCGVTTAAAAYCWGIGANGRLGDGDDAAVFQTIPVAVLGGLTFASVSAGDAHSCGVTTAGAAYCWGFGVDGDLLGTGATERQLTPAAVSGGLTFASVSAGFRHTCGITTSGAAYCWGTSGAGRLGDGSGENSTTPVAVSGGLTFASLIAHSSHTCGVTTSGAAYCWGGSDSGKLGDGSGKHQFTPAAVSGPR